MIVKTAAAFPLLTHDPYFSIWSATDFLNGSDPIHWSGARQQLKGYLIIDDVPYCFLGKSEHCPKLLQTSICVTATSTQYQFEHEKASFTVKFTSPLLPDDPLLLSRPCSYVDMTVARTTSAKIRILFILSAELVRETPGTVIGGSFLADDFHYGCMGKAFQHPLGSSGDNTTIDWGWLYLASQNPEAEITYSDESEVLQGSIELFGANSDEDTASVSWIVAYDDLLSIYYFGEWKKAYWATQYPSILEAIRDSFKTHNEIAKKCSAFDQALEKDAFRSGGEDYVYLCCMSYRQTISAHKLIADEQNNLIFLSKENDSNGCIGTVDVTYPSVPLFFLYNPELVKGMLRPIFRFAQCPIWSFDFAPHDVGRYPYASGQVYGLSPNADIRYLTENHAIYPFFHQFPAGCSIYNLDEQMPAEECGNMLILTAVVCLSDHSADFAAPYMQLLEKWVKYLEKYGFDPGSQLCTDDFAGHLAHNTNLSVKAILGIEGYAQILKLLGRLDLSRQYHTLAREMAKNWEKRAVSDSHYRLAFDKENSWSLKYNLVWDKIFNSQLFSQDVYEKELLYYVSKQNTYGVPLDNRASYTKSDWILWCAAFTQDLSIRNSLIAPVAAYLKNTHTRVPFSDWYDTISGNYCHFIARSVQGGIFMPLFIDCHK